MEEKAWSHGKIVPVQIDKEMRSSYIDYAMSVIVMRALPDVRDGLKPVHRRILYAMHETGMTPSKPYKKSARIVGDVLGKYHPHGDSSVYDATVRLAQDFNTRYPLVDGHGNFGSIDGDSAAAMRYTEVRMSRIATEMLADIEKKTVDFMPNYDESLEEPTVLPAKIPNLLINGSAGIAVGMATNIPPHNLGEVVDGLVMLIDDPEVDVNQLMTAIKGPDFPTGASILGREGIKKAYATGRGSIKMRAKAHIEAMTKGKHRIVVTEIPYQVNKARLIATIADLSRDKVVDGITALRDESDRRGLRIVIELRADVQPDIVLNKLYKHTQLQDTFGVIMLALVKGHPKVLTLKEVLGHYLTHRQEVIVRRTEFDLAKAEARAHVLEGLLIALDHIDEVIHTIRSSQTTDIARTALIEQFSLTEIQANAILDMRLARLTGLEREKIEEEHAALLVLIADLKAILASDARQREIIKEELIAMKEKYGDKRRSEITIDTSDFDVEDLIADEEMVITLTRQGYIKRMNANVYRNQHKGGVGVVGMKTKEDDYVAQIMHVRTHNTLLFFTSTGRAYRLKAYEVPEASSRNSRGTAIINVLPLNVGETVTNMIDLERISSDVNLFMVTKQGVVKRTSIDEYRNIRRGGLNAVALDEGDQLISVGLTYGNQDVLLGTKKGMAIRFHESDVRLLKRAARGVKGINLNAGDEVVGASIIHGTGEECQVFTISEEGYGKRNVESSYTVQKRGGKGTKNFKITDKTGEVVAVEIVNDNDEMMLISEQGKIIRFDVNDIAVKKSKAISGVKTQNLDEGDKIASVAVISSEELKEDESLF